MVTKFERWLWSRRFQVSKIKLVKKSTSIELTLYDFDKCIQDITNTPIATEKTSFRSKSHKVYIVTLNKTTVSYGDDETQDEDMIAAYPHRSNKIYINYFNDKDIPNSTEELKSKYKTLIENDQLWWWY